MSEPSLEQAKILFAEIRKSLDVNKSLQWAVSINGLKAASIHFNTVEAQLFITEYLYKVLHLMTQQSPSKLGAFEKKVMEDALLVSLEILIRILPHHHNSLQTLSRIFDQNIPFYSGSKVGYSFTPGFPHVRTAVAKRFAEWKGFVVLSDLFRREDFLWPGGECMMNIIKTMNIQEVISCLQAGIREEIVNATMLKMLSLPDESLKRENTDILSNLINALFAASNNLAIHYNMPQCLHKFQIFWMENTWKEVNSGSLVLKLFGWEQLNDIIIEAKSTRPLASRYIIEGAGTNCVNGIYEKVIVGSKLNASECEQTSYVKISTQPGVPHTLTLFRCTMRNKAKWWFISQADAEKPGTDKDIDYYLHKSQACDEREPPQLGWTCVNTGINLIGQNPLPILKKDGLLLARGISKEDFLDSKLLDWCRSKEILTTIFGGGGQSTMHREILARCGRLLLFLAEYEQLSLQDLQLIWKAAVQSHEYDIMDEIFSQFVPILPYLHADLFTALIKMAQDTLQQQPENFGKVAQFVEKFTVNGFQYVNELLLTTRALSELLSLVWDVVMCSSAEAFEALKCGQVLQELLSNCLRQKGGSETVMKRITECKEVLIVAYNRSSSSGSTTVENEEEKEVEVEKVLSKVIQTLYFLLDKHATSEMVEQIEASLLDCLVNEIHRYVLCSRRAHMMLGTYFDPILFSSQLAARLRILRRIYALLPTRTIPLASIESLSQLLLMQQQQQQHDHSSIVGSLELEEFFLFLKSSSSSSNNNSPLEALVSPIDALSIFRSCICSPHIDWSKCGEGAFECFRTYYSELEGASSELPSNTLLPPKLGLDTLWRIALDIAIPSATNNAIMLLLKAYDSLLVSDSDAYRSMLQIIFSFLNDAMTSHTNTAAATAGGNDTNESSVLSPSGRLVRVSRCVSILSSALVSSKGYLLEPAHAVRGCMSRIRITVFYRRVTSYFNPATQSDIVRVEKGSDGRVKLEVHSLHTIAQLKQRIINVADLGGVSIYINANNDSNVSNNNRFDADMLNNDSTRLGELGLVDGSILHVNYQASYRSAIQHRKAFDDNDDDLYSGNNSTTDNELYLREGRDNNYSGPLHIGQILANDSTQFNCLLSLCDMFKDSNSNAEKELTRNIWQLLMMIPTQTTLMQQYVEQICFPEGSAYELPVSPLSIRSIHSDWNHVLLVGNHLAASASRTTYLLQIIDNLMQPAPELAIENSELKTKSKLFKDAFISTGGFPAVLRVLINTPSNDNNIINSNALAVALHILHYLLFGHEVTHQQRNRSASRSMSITLLDDGNTNAAAAADVLLAEPADVTMQQWESISTAASLLEQIESCSAEVIEKLLHVARNAAAHQDSGVVQNALIVITKLIKSPEAASQLSSNPQSEVLLTTVLRSASKKVRHMASTFAVQVGRSQPIVFHWLLKQLKNMQPTDEYCAEIFGALSILLLESNHKNINKEHPSEEVSELAAILSDKLLHYPRNLQQPGEERHVLLGYLQTLELLIEVDQRALMATSLGEHLVPCFLSDFLFSMPSSSSEYAAVSGSDSSSSTGAICDTSQTRQAAFNVLSAYLSTSMDGFDHVLGELNTLSKLAARHIHSNWGLQVSHDVKKPDIQFSGLKNQGCTCYMNSLLQVLFMSTAFREGVLATPLLECHRTSLWHRTDEDIVGHAFFFENSNNTWRAGLITDFDPLTAKHCVQYTKSDGSVEELAIFNIHEGRVGRETGRVKIIPPDDETAAAWKDQPPLSEQDEAAYRVLDQLQRTFCFMKLSKRRFFDPVPFVEACKSLNLNFNVYHQNDAAEFCDQLLDRIETATKGKHTKKDMWKEVFMHNVFGGQWQYQKIPQDCDIYSTDKTGCGHWQSSRQESFLKVELMIRGKDKIEDSLGELMQGELMDGDNKIHCDVCTQKKATVRRTCFGGLPNTLILHLKRFDLDFQTFETVKLNNRMAFPSHINMLKYTKEGIEAEEKRAAKQLVKEAAAASNEDKASSGPNALQYEADDDEEDGENELDESDYDYELQGVLVHAGVAQGGHYYSFIRDGDTSNEWYKFDDDEVTPFDSHYIPLQCFGGPPSANNNNNNGMNNNNNNSDEDRTSNALMLLYNKVKRQASSASESDIVTAAVKAEGDVNKARPATLAPLGSSLVMVDGMQAYRREVHESNMQHILSCYLLESNLHAFVRSLISSIATKKLQKINTAAVDLTTAISLRAMPYNELQWSPSMSADDLSLRTVQFGCSFLLDVVLHCRERATMRSSVAAFKEAFRAYPHSAMWLIRQLLDTATCSWLQDYLLLCTDAPARATFVQILIHAMAVVAPTDKHAMLSFKSMKSSDIKALLRVPNSGAELALLVRMIVDFMFKSVNHVRTSDELFVLIRDLAAIPSICCALLDAGIIAFLSYFIMPDLTPNLIVSLFEKHLVITHHTGGRNNNNNNNSRPDYSNLLQNVFEAIAALLGVPQLRKVNLLQDRSYWDSELVPDAREAFTTIFEEMARANGVMDHSDMIKYFERVTAVTGPKMTVQQMRGLLERFVSHEDNKLHLDGFLQYQTDTASYSPKNVWRDLHAFGYKNDLSRSVSTTSAASSSLTATTVVATTAATTDDEAAATASTHSDESKNDATTTVPVEAVTAASCVEKLPLTDNCRLALGTLAFYEVGMSVCEAAARAIAKRICYFDAKASSMLLSAALDKLYAITSENAWNSHPVNLVNEFIRLLLSIDDGEQRSRLYALLVKPNAGFAVVVYREKMVKPTNCRTNEYNKYNLVERYLSFSQDLLAVPGVLSNLTELAKQDAQVAFLRGNLKLKLSENNPLTEHEDELVRSHMLVLQDAGNHEVNGEYHFHSVRCAAGYYSRYGQFGDNPHAHFTLYKHTLKNGGVQWFLSVTPDGMEPGTTHDIDLYYSPAKQHDRIPVLPWQRMNSNLSRDPPPIVQCVRIATPITTTDGGGDSAFASAPPVPVIGLDNNDDDDEDNIDDEDDEMSSDSEKNNYLMVSDDNNNIDDSFVSNSSTLSGFYH